MTTQIAPRPDIIAPRYAYGDVRKRTAERIGPLTIQTASHSSEVEERIFNSGAVLLRGVLLAGLGIRVLQPEAPEINYRTVNERCPFGTEVHTISHQKNYSVSPVLIAGSVLLVEQAQALDTQLELQNYRLRSYGESAANPIAEAIYANRELRGNCDAVLVYDDNYAEGIVMRTGLVQLQ